MHVVEVCIVSLLSCLLLGIVSFIAPCYYFGKNSESVGENCVLCGLLYLLFPVNVFAAPHIRGKIREQKGIEVSSMHDTRCTNNR